MVTAWMAMVCGCDDAEAMRSWGEANATWLGGLLDLPHAPPTEDVFLAVSAALDSDAFGAVFRAWAQMLALRLEAHGKHIAVDGKTSRRSFDTATEQGARHTVSVWMSAAGLVLGPRQTDRTANEITAIPALLWVLDRRGATVTVDAMGRPTETAPAIVDAKGYCLGALNAQERGETRQARRGRGARGAALERCEHAPERATQPDGMIDAPAQWG